MGIPPGTRRRKEWLARLPSVLGKRWSGNEARRLTEASLIALLATGIFGGCDGLDGYGDACTLIGCTSGVSVVLENLPATPFRVEEYWGSPNGPRCDPLCRQATIRLPSDAIAVTPLASHP
jgi:hypothetical protein